MTRNAVSGPTWHLQPCWRHSLKRRIGGIWFRDGAYSAQLRVNGVVLQIKLHAETIPEALKARQDLKSKIPKREYPPKVEHPAQPKPEEDKPVRLALLPGAKANHSSVRFDRHEQRVGVMLTLFSNSTQM
jgi:hypothetical protein